MEIKTTVCDLCKKEATIKNQMLSIIFLTDQEEGIADTPYIDNKKLDLCKDCLGEILKGKAIYGKGAMGYNDYSFTRFWK